MPPSPAMRCSPGREPRAEIHKRGRSLEGGIVFKDRDDDLALFNEVQSRERDNFLLQSEDDFEDTFTSKLRHFSDHKLGINIPARGESSDLLRVEEEKNDYEWLLTPPETPLFPSLDDEAPQVNLVQRGRPRTQPISISRSSTMEKSHRSSRGSASPNRLSPSPRSSNDVFEARGRASSAPSSSPPATLRPMTASRRPSPPSSKRSTPPPRASTPTPRRLSTGSNGNITTSGARGISPVKTSRGKSASPKVRAWQSNIPGFSSEVPPNLRTSLADRPASYVRGSSPASRNSRQSRSPTASRSIGSSHSKGSVASSAEDDVESLPSITVGSFERSNARRVAGFSNNRASLAKKPSRAISSSSAPKRSFDQALRQMDQRKGPQNMFRPLLSSVPSSSFYAGIASSGHRTMISRNSSVTTSSNASSGMGTCGTLVEINRDDATSGFMKVPDSDADDEVFVLEKADYLNDDMGDKGHDGDFVLENLDDSNEQVNFAEIDFVKGMLICCRCGCGYSLIEPVENDEKLCADCIKSNSPLTITSPVAAEFSQIEAITTERTHESFAQTTPFEPPEVSQSGQHEDSVKDGQGQSQSQSTYGEPIWNFLAENSLSRQECEPRQISPPSVSYSDAGSDRIKHTISFQNPKADSLEGAGISILLKRSTSIKGPVVRSMNFSASSISYDDFSYARDSTNSMRSSVGHGSVSASSSVDFGPNRQTDTRFQRQSSSRISDTDNYKYDPNPKHQRSGSSLSGTSSHSFHPSSLGTASLTPQENIENDEQKATPMNPIIPNSEECLLTESLECEEESPSLQKVDMGALTSAVDQDQIPNLCANSTDVAEVPLDTISEGELDHTCQSSPASKCDRSLSLKSNVEEPEDPPVTTTLDKDVAVSAEGYDTPNHSSNIIEESRVLVGGQGKAMGRSLTLEEATDTILFCSSIVHNLAYDAATIALDKENLPHPSDNHASWPLVPATRKADLEPQTKKRPSKSQKSRHRKVPETATAESPDSNGKTDGPKTRMVGIQDSYHGGDNAKPPKLESKCNCTIM